MYDRPRSFTPPDRVLRWIATVASRYPRGVPNDRFVRHLKGDLSGLSFAQLDQALRLLESRGLVRKEWDTPGEFRVFLTDDGQEVAKQLEKQVLNAAPPVARGAPAAPPFVAPPPGQVTPMPPGVYSPQAGFAPPPPPGYPAPSGPVPPGPPGTPDEGNVSMAGRSPGPIPSRGPPASANLPVRILLYCLLYGADRPETDPTVPGEDLSRYLLNQGFLLAEDYLQRLFAGLEKRELVTYAPRPTGGYDLHLTAKGRHLAEGLLSGHISSRAAAGPEEGPAPLGTPSDGATETPPAPAPATDGAAPAPGPAAPGTTTGPEFAELQGQLEAARQGLRESEEKRQQDRATVDELLHQMELQEQQIHELQEALARATGAPSDAGAGTPGSAEAGGEELAPLFAPGPPPTEPEGEGAGARSEPSPAPVEEPSSPPPEPPPPDAPPPSGEGAAPPEPDPPPS